MGQSRTLLVLCLGGLLVLAGCVGPAQQPAGNVSGETPGETPTPVRVNGTLDVHVINVGQSESTLIVGQNETILVDTGDFTDDGKYVLQYLEARGIDRLDHLVVTHADADHIGGTAAVIEHFEQDGKGVGAVYDPGIAASTRTYERYLDAVEEFDVTLFETRAGDRIDYADADIDVLGPPEPYLADRERNENSIVFKLTHGNASFLFTGDAGRIQEEYLVDTYGDELRSTVLKAGHHGSASSSTASFLAAVDPAVATLSSAYDSQYGHPDEEVLDRLAAQNVSTYWTATHGTIRFTSDGEQVTIATQKAAPADPERLREGEPLALGSPEPLQQRAVISATDRTVRDETATAATPTATDGGTTAETPTASPLELVDVHADAAGDDRENLDDEYLVFENTGEAALDMSGWTVEDDADHAYTIPAGFTLAPGERVTLYTGAGTDSDTELYWNNGQPIWNNDGDTILVTNANGTRVLTETYG